MTDLRAGLVGFGQMGRNHARVLQSLPGIELVGIADPVAVGSPALPGVPFVGDVADLTALGIDMAVVSVPTVDHEAIATHLAEHGVHTLVEKPVTPDVLAAERLAAAFEAAGVICCVGHIERYNPALQEMRRRLEHGEVGEVYQIATRRQGPFPERISDVGVVLDLATHDIDLTAWVAQRGYLNVAARTANRSGREHEDLVAAVGTLEGGIVVSHLVNWLSPLKERITVVTGERGSLVADTVSADLTFFANGVAPVRWDAVASFQGVVQGDVTKYAFPKREPLVIELEAFRDAVLGKTDRTVSVRDAARTVAVAEALIAASDSDHTVRLAETH